MGKYVLAYKGGSILQSEAEHAAVMIEATSLDDAATKAKGCPVLAAGGTVDVYETIEVG